MDPVDRGLASGGRRLGLRTFAGFNDVIGVILQEVTRVPTPLSSIVFAPWCVIEYCDHSVIVSRRIKILDLWAILAGHSHLAKPRLTRAITVIAHDPKARPACVLLGRI